MSERRVASFEAVASGTVIENNFIQAFDAYMENQDDLNLQREAIEYYNQLMDHEAKLRDLEVEQRKEAEEETDLEVQEVEDPEVQEDEDAEYQKYLDYKEQRAQEELDSLSDEDRLDIMKQERADIIRQAKIQGITPAIPFELESDIMRLEDQIAAKRNAPNPLDAIKDDKMKESFSAKNILNIINKNKKDC